MEDIAKNIDDQSKLEDNASAFRALSREEKLQLLERLKIVKTGTLGQFLNRVYGEESDKEVQKTIKRLLFRLRTLGVEVEEPRIQGEPVLRKIEEQKAHRGLMSNYDQKGTRLVVAAFQSKRNAYLLVHSITHFSDGLLELANLPVDRRGLDAVFKEYIADAPASDYVGEVSPKFAWFLIEESANASGAYGDEIRRLRSFVSRYQGEVQKPEDIYGLVTSDITTVMTEDRVLSHPIFTPLPLTWPQWEDDRQNYRTIGTSSILLPPYMVEERRDTFLKTLLESERMKPLLSPVKRVAEDYAYLLFCRGEFGAYKGLIELLKGGSGPHRILHFFVKRVLDAAEKTEDRAPGGLIINPYEQIRR
jgi:hypothetical protein